MENLLNGISLIIVLPLVLGFAFGLGYILRSMLSKGEIKNGFGSIILSIICGIIVIAVLGSAFEGCNDGDENTELWRRD